MNSRRCTGCGAPLAAESGGKCPFCGLEHDGVGISSSGNTRVTYEREKLTIETAPAPPTPPSPLLTEAEKQQMRAAGRAVGKGVAAVGCGSGCGLVVLTCLAIFTACGVASCLLGSLVPPSRPTSSASSSSSSSPSSSGTTAASSPARLRELTAGTMNLDVQPPAEGYRAWDPIVQIPWAQAIATAWSREAFLQRIDVTGVESEGVIDLGPDRDGEVIYRFWPTARPSQYAVESEAPDIATGRELWIRVKQSQPVGVVSALTVAPDKKKRRGKAADDKAPDDKATVRRPAAAQDSLPLRDIFARLSTRADVSPAARYTGALEYVDRDGWTWQLTDGAGASLRIRARDGGIIVSAPPR